MHRAFRNKVLMCMECNFQKANRMPTTAEIERLRLLKQPYAEVDYIVSMVDPEVRTNWLEADES